MRAEMLAVIGTATVILGSSGTARADEAVFGKAGGLVLGSDLNLVAIGSLYSLASSLNGGGGYALLTPASMLSLGGSSTSNNGGSTFGVSVAPAADYFVIDNLSIGLELLIGYATYSPPSFNGMSAQGGNTTTYGFAPRVGYNIPLGTSLSLWPKVFFEYAGYSEGGSGSGYGNVQLLGAYVPIVDQVTRHFFIGLGPNIVTELGASSDGSSASSKTTAYGLFASIGGWFALGE
jgi:hypothetical protein